MPFLLSLFGSNPSPVSLHYKQAIQKKEDSERHNEGDISAVIAGGGGGFGAKYKEDDSTKAWAPYSNIFTLHCNLGSHSINPAATTNTGLFKWWHIRIFARDNY
jgi:hypothetical protein